MAAAVNLHAEPHSRGLGPPGFHFGHELPTLGSVWNSVCGDEGEASTEAELVKQAVSTRG